MAHENTRLTDDILEAARRPMTPAERREQRISFIMGSVGDENSRPTREEVEDLLQEKGLIPDDPS